MYEQEQRALEPPPARGAEPRIAQQQGPVRVRLGGIIFGVLRPVLIDPSIDPPAFHCFNCWQPGHGSGHCPRPKVRHYCRNCGRHGEDLRTCPRCSEAHAAFLRHNFVHEQEHERELDQRRRDALRLERERVEEMHLQQYLAEQEWRSRMAAAQQMQRHHHPAAMQPRHELPQVAYYSGRGNTLVRRRSWSANCAFCQT